MRGAVQRELRSLQRAGLVIGRFERGAAVEVQARDQRGRYAVVWQTCKSHKTAVLSRIGGVRVCNSGAAVVLRLRGALGDGCGQGGRVLG